MIKNLGEILLAAAALVERNGYFEGDFYPNACSVSNATWPFSERPFSSYGAIRMAAGDGERLARDEDAAEALLFAAWRLSDWSVIRDVVDADWALQAWEDEAHLDAAAVVAALRTLAAEAVAVSA